MYVYQQLIFKILISFLDFIELKYKLENIKDINILFHTKVYVACVRPECYILLMYCSFLFTYFCLMDSYIITDGTSY